jgi:carboxylesterase type B
MKPVIVWFHGGGNTEGSGSDATFDGGPLSSRADVVVVSVEYRLGAFGYLSWDRERLPGNYALSDKIAALEWCVVFTFYFSFRRLLTPPSFT